jgi:hypothetical protein
VSSSYRFSDAFIVRLTGRALTAVGLLVLVVAAVSLALSLPSVVLRSAVVIALVTWVGLLVALAVLRRNVVVRLDALGYHVRHVRAAGVRDGRWKDVEDAAATTVGGHRCVSLRLRDGRTTTIPVDLLSGDSEAFVRDLRQHLDDGHGYRPLSA